MLLVNCNKSKKVEKENFIEFFTFTVSDTNKVIQGMYNYKVRRFMVQNYNGYNDTLYKNFAIKKIKEIDSVFKQIDVVFYRKSKITNIEHLSKNPRDLDRYSEENDKVYEFTGSTLYENLSMTKYKKGEIISRRDPSIKIE